MGFRMCFSLITIIVLNTCKEDAGQNQQFTPDVIIENYYKAIGGYDSLNAIKDIEKLGYYIEPAYNFLIPANMKRMRPDYKHVGNLETVGFEEGYNGVPWEYHDGKGLILSEGAAAEAILVSKDFDYAFINAEIKGHSLHYLGIQDFGGLAAHAIEVTIPILENSYKTTFLFDLKSFLLLGQRKTMPIHAVGDDVVIHVSYSDFRKVNGVLFPFASIERNAATGMFLNAVIWSEIIPNTNMPVSVFDPPSP